MVFLLWHGCNHNKNKVTQAADFSGYITEVKFFGEGEGVIKAESYINKLVQRWEINVNKNTLLVREGNDRPISLSAFQVTNRIQVWFSEISIKDNLSLGHARQVILSSRKRE